jgi:hypothetical protein
MDMYFVPHLKNFIEHLPKDGNAALSLLKVHLLIEEIFNLVIERNMKRPDFLRKSRLSFAQKLVLAQGFLSGASDAEWVWKAVEELNEARNKLAHNLDKRKMEGRLEAFIKRVEDVEGPPPDDAINGPMQRFQLSALKVFMHTVHIVEIDPSDVKIKIILGNGGISLEQSRDT